MIIFALVSCLQKSPLRERQLSLMHSYGGVSGLPRWLSGKESACQYRRHEFNPWVGKRSPGERNGNPLQYSCLWNPMDRGDWRATVHGITKSQTRLSIHACTHTHTHTHKDVGHKRNWFQWPLPHLGDFAEAFHELSNLCVPKYLILKLLYTTPQSLSTFSASTRLSSLRAGTMLSHCPAQSLAAPAQQGHTHTRDFSEKTWNFVI